jgi:hypothetical protein
MLHEMHAALRKRAVNEDSVCGISQSPRFARKALNPWSR